MKSSSAIIRSQFIDFFKSKQHTFVPSSPVVPQDDPTLLFTNAGMNQFKAIFLGENRLGLTRAANSQKCMRVSGKHNDLEEVGRDHYHHTFFEMLGNWSFGDYYKKEAITWAWELLTGVWKMPKERLYATVFRDDDEAIGFWKSCTDIAHDHIGRYDEKSNFWEMGETGPCGPCSEVHMDMGKGICPNENDPGHTCGVNVDGCARYMELWNLVFMQYNREKGGKLTPLPATHVDTGMGFERIVRVIQETASNYETDLFTPIIAEIEKMSGKKYAGTDEGTPFRVIADHIRSLTFAITDGAFPGNEGRGYVLRRLLRRACRFGRELGFSQPFLYKLVPVVIDISGKAFPEIGQRGDFVVQVVRAEEERFIATLEQGIALFEQAVERSRTAKSDLISGADVFALYDTYGFPTDLTRLMAQERNLSIDEAGYEVLMTQQKKRGRDNTKKGDAGGLSADGWTEIVSCSGTTFVGYDSFEAMVKICRYKKVAVSADCVQYLMIFDTTPFYAEQGGQVGDSGTLTTCQGRVVQVDDTIKWNDMVVHKVTCDAELSSDELAAPFKATINADLRNATRKNHTATHLLQAALRSVLGDHVQQSGSRVDPLGLRFDFTHFKALTPDELAAVERKVNEWIQSSVSVSTSVLPIDQARAAGAIALFGEKYGETVRVVSVDNISKEFCGGTHVSSIGQIGICHIVSESSTSAGVRRIEAVTGMGAISLLTSNKELLYRLNSTLKTNNETIVGRIESMLDTIREQEETLKKLTTQQAGAAVAELLSTAEKNRGAFAWAVKNIGSVDKAEFAQLSDAVTDVIKSNNLADVTIVLGAVVGDKVMFSASAGNAAVQKHKIHCGDLVKQAAAIAGGGGGGSPNRAQAGGKDPAKLAEAIEKVRSLLQERSAA